MEEPRFNYDSSNIFNDLFFTWTFPIINFYKKNPPQPSNLLKVPKTFYINETFEALEIEWEKEIEKPKPNFFKALMRVIWWDCTKYFIPGIIGYNLSLIQSLLVIYLISFIQDSGTETWVGACYIIAYAGASFGNFLLLNYSIFKVWTLIIRVKAIVPMLLYKKILNVSHTVVSQGNTKGKVSNVIASELEFLDQMIVLILLFAIPTYLLGAFLILGFTIGVAGIIGILVVILHCPINYILGKWTGKYRMKVAIHTDGRIKMITNLIEGIRIVKLYGWESPYLEAIFMKRREEIKAQISKINFLSLYRMIGGGGVGLVLFVTFAVQWGLGNSLDPGVVFSTVTILMVTHILVSIVGAMSVVQLFLFAISMKRITETLLMKGRNPKSVSESEKYAVQTKNASFAWNEIPEESSHKTKENLIEPTTATSEVVLTNINIKIIPGELLVVIGPVGCGKSSLLMGLLQEIPLADGKLNIGDKLSYAGDDPWIIPGTLKDNILMGTELDEEFYKKTLYACALEKDIESFPFKDNTVVGDRGITLSGGQKARLSLARAVYSRRDIVLLDDPLSAVDAEVGHHLFEKCIREILKEKTVILATHQIHFMNNADKILVLEKGRQLFFGNYQELTEREDISHIVGELIKENDEEIIEILKKRETEVGEKAAETKDKLTIQEEERASGSVPMSVYFRFLMFGFKSCLVFPLVILVLVIAQAFYVAVVWWLAIWASQSDSDQEDSMYLWILGIIVIAHYIFAYIRGYILGVGMILSAKHLHNKALEGMAKAESVFYDKNPTGRMINRFSKDTLVMDEVLTIFFFDLINNTVVLLANIIVAVIIAPPNIAVLFGLVIYLILLMRYIVPVTKDLRRIEMVSKSPILSLVNSSVHGLVTIRTLGFQAKFNQDMKDAVIYNMRALLGYQIVMRCSQVYTELGANVVNVINIIVFMLYKDTMDKSLVAMSISLIISCCGISSYWAKTMVETENQMASPQRLIEYADMSSEGEFETKEPFHIAKGKIEFQNLSMKYRDNFDLVLKDLSLTIEAGKTVGIVGRTGAGKSSIMQVLFRLTNPCAGTILLDDQDYRYTGLHQLRKQMSVIPQFPTIFMASFRDNLDPFHEHSDEDIIDVVQQTKLAGLINSYPKGLNTMLIGEGGNLSAGEKQLICLARALIRRNKIVMMDEATANVDHETDKFIHKQIKTKFSESTVLIVAHRLRTVIDADMIIFMESGACKEYGSPYELGNNEKSAFRKMIMSTGPQESQHLLKKISLFED